MSTPWHADEADCAFDNGIDQRAAHALLRPLSTSASAPQRTSAAPKPSAPRSPRRRVRLAHVERMLAAAFATRAREIGAAGQTADRHHGPLQ